MRVWLGLLSCLAWAAACSNPALDTHVERIVDGELSGKNEDGVLLLRAEVDGAEVLCSASLVAPNLVVTARHCVSYLTPGLFNCTVRGELIDNPEGGGRLGQHLSPASIEIFDNSTPRRQALARGTRVISTLSPAICINDIAFVVIDAPIDLPIVPIRLEGSARAKEEVSLVGYGLTDERQGIDYLLQKRRRKGQLAIAGVGPDSIDDGVTTVPPRALILNGPSGCVGDSGGPLLAASSGALLGVYSLQAGESCTAPDVRHQLVHVTPFRALMEEAFEAAGATPTPEPDSSLEGGGGALGSAGQSSAGDASSGASSSTHGDTTSDEGPADSSCAMSRTRSGSAMHWLGLAALALGVRTRRKR